MNGEIIVLFREPMKLLKEINENLTYESISSQQNNYLAFVYMIGGVPGVPSSSSSAAGSDSGTKDISQNETRRMLSEDDVASGSNSVLNQLTDQQK